MPRSSKRGGDLRPCSTAPRRGYVRRRPNLDNWESDDRDDLLPHPGTGMPGALRAMSYTRENGHQCDGDTVGAVNVLHRRLDTTREGVAMVTVFLVDDHEVVRRGLIDLLGADPELDVIGEAGTVAEAMARIPALRPDVAVLDVRLPDGNGIELCRDLLSRLPDLRCLMLTSFTSDEAMLDAILAGASGFVVKDIKGMELAKAIKDVGAGRSLLDNRAAAALMAKLRGGPEPADPLGALTAQERILLDLLGEGLTNRQIAARMFLAEKTVKNYVSRLLAKLGMQRRTQAAVFASKHGQLVHREV